MKSEKSSGRGLTCAASLLTTSSCLLLSSGVPGQLPPPSSSPPLPKELWDKETASMSVIHNQCQYLVKNKYIYIYLFVTFSIVLLLFSLCMTSWSFLMLGLAQILPSSLISK